LVLAVQEVQTQGVLLTEIQVLIRFFRQLQQLAVVKGAVLLQMPRVVMEVAVAVVAKVVLEEVALLVKDTLEEKIVLLLMIIMVVAVAVLVALVEMLLAQQEELAEQVQLQILPEHQ
jgi:hypothetical protein